MNVFAQMDLVARNNNEMLNAISFDKSNTVGELTAGLYSSAFR